MSRIGTFADDDLAGWFAKSPDLGGAIVALTNPGADWITGNVINVDGGEEISA